MLCGGGVGGELLPGTSVTMGEATVRQRHPTSIEVSIYSMKKGWCYELNKMPDNCSESISSFDYIENKSFESMFHVCTRLLSLIQVVLFITFQDMYMRISKFIRFITIIKLKCKNCFLYNLISVNNKTVIHNVDNRDMNQTGKTK